MRSISINGKAAICFIVTAKAIPVKSLAALAKDLKLAVDRSDRRGPLLAALQAKGVAYVANACDGSGKLVGVREVGQTLEVLA